MKKFLIIAFLLLGTGVFNDYLAQTGGKKREHRNQRRRGSIFKRSKSAGNADKFAAGGGKRSMFSRLFKKQQPAWTNRTSGSARSNQRANRSLFSRYRTRGKQYNSQVLAKQNADRSRRRIRGNKTFSRKKY